MDQNQQPFMSKKQVVSIIVITVIIVSGGVFVVQKYVPSFAPSQNIFRAEIFTTHTTPVVSMPKITYAISGIVKSISPKLVSFEPNTLDVRMARISTETRVVRVLMADIQDVQKEEEELRKNIQNPKMPISEQIEQFKITPPQEIAGTLADIKVGMHIVVVAEEDTANANEINALEIRIQ